MHIIKYAILAAVACISLAAPAEIVWDWSFVSESGQFVTDGSNASPGTYTLLDFSVTASATGGTIGSLSAGDYLTGAWDTDEPFSFYWDGGQVIQWMHTGENSFDWWTFQDSADPMQTYDFGWDIGNVNDPTKGSHWSSDEGALAGGDVLVAPIPEPTSLSLMVLVFGGICFLRRRASHIP